MKKLSGFLFGATVMAISLVAHAVDRDFTIHNSTGMVINEIHISPHSSSHWGRDILGQDVLATGAATTIHFTPQDFPGECNFDIRIVDTANHPFDVMSINLCTITDATFSRQGSTVTVSAH